MSKVQELETLRPENDEEITIKSSQEETSQTPSVLKESPKTEPVRTEASSPKIVASTPLEDKKEPIPSLEATKPGECNNLLPVLVERLRSALEQSCSSQSSEEANQPLEDSGVDSEEDLRVWASGLMDQTRAQETQSPRALKLDLKFLEDLLLSDIQTGLARLQETLQEVDVNTLTRYSSTLDPTNKLNLLKLISSLLANLKIPKPEKAAKTQTSLPRRRRSDRHTIGVSAEELASARKWLEEKSLSPGVVESCVEVPLQNPRNSLEDPQEKKVIIGNDSTAEKLEVDKNEKVQEKYMKDAINQQQSMQSKSKESQRDISAFYNPQAAKPLDTSYKDDNTIINEELGISASSLYHQSSAKSNKFLAKKSKIKRANTIDIPNYLKLQAESLARAQNGCVSLRRPINIGDRFSSNGGHVIPSFEPKTENDRKFLALISKNTENTTTSPGAILPFKSFNYRQAQADKNWNNRFSNIKTTFDKPQDENETRGKENLGLVVGSLRIPCNGMRNKPVFSHAPTSAFQKIEKAHQEETTPGFLKPGYVPKGGSLLQAKVKMFDQDNSSSQPILTTSNRSKARPLDPRRGNLFSSPEPGPENAHLNYHSFCKQFAPFAIKSPEQKRTPWAGNVVGGGSKDKFEGKVDKKEDSKVLKGSENQERGQSRKARKLYDNYDGSTVVPEPRDVVAFPFEVNYQKRGFGNKFRDNMEEKGRYESPEDVRQLRSPPVVSLQYIKSALGGRNPSPPPRGIFAVQSVAVQTGMEPPRPVYPETRAMGREENQRRAVLAGGVNNEIGVGRGVKESVRRGSREDFADYQVRRGSSGYGESLADLVKGQREDLPEPVRRGSRYHGENLVDLYQPPLPIKPQRDDLTEHLRRSSRQYAENLGDLYQPPLPPKPQREQPLSEQIRRGSRHYADNSIDPYQPPRPIKPQREDLPEQLRRSSRHYEDNLSDNYQSSSPMKAPREEVSELRRGSRHYSETLIDPYQPPLPIKPHKEDLPEQIRRESRYYADNLIDSYQPPVPIKPQREDLPEQVRRGSRHYAENSDHYQPPPPPPPPVLPQRGDMSFPADSQTPNNYPGQGRPCLSPQTTNHQLTHNYSPNTDYNKPQYFPPTEAYAQNSFGHTPPQIPVRANPPQKASQPLIKTQDYSRYENRMYEDPRIRDFQESPNFYDALSQNPVYQRPSENIQDNQTLPSLLLQPTSHAYNPEDISSLDESADVSEDQSFAEDENIQNQDISSEGVVTRYACAIATVSSASESPAISPLPVLKEDPRAQKIFEVPHQRVSDELSFEEIRRHNLLQQNLIRQLQGEQPMVTKPRISQENINRDEPLRSPTNVKPPEDPGNEPVIESNNTQEKINIFEGRNSSMKKQKVFKPLSIPRPERENFAPPKINVVSPSKAFKPSFNVDTRGAKIQVSKAGKKSSVDSSDEYLMSCANKPSRSIVLSKSESWHQLAMAKSSLQVPQSQPTSSLVKPSKPKSPSSLRLSKQYEASSSSDAIRKMEDKIQRYFQGPSGAPDSPIATRRDPKNKRNFTGKKSQGNLMRSHTMPHIYDETSDVDKAFDSLFKEATRTDNRY